MKNFEIEKIEIFDLKKIKNCHSKLYENEKIEIEKIENFRLDFFSFGRNVVASLPINRFLIFWTQNYVDFSRGGA